MNEVNNIPEGWVETTLGKSINLVGGGTPITSNPDFWNGTIPWLSVVDFNNDNRWVYSAEKSITELGLRKSSTKLLNIGDIIISARGTVGAMAQLKNKMAFNQSCYGIKEKENFTDINFIFYLLKYSLKQINRNTYGAVFDTITTKTFDVINVILPPLPEQKSIAAILTSFDDKIELLQAQNKTLEELAQTIFKEWFGKYNIDDELPDGWGVGKLSDFNAVIADFVANGSFASLKENVTLYDYEEYALFMRNTDLKSGFVQKTYVDKKSYEFLSKTKLFGGEIIISNVGDVGSVHFCPYFDIPMTLGNNVIMLKSEFQYYFYTMFNSKIGQHLISSITGGSAQPKFNKTDFRNMGMIIPSEDILLKFEDVASKLYLKILKNKEQIQTLTKTRDALLPKLMSGEIRVKKQFFENFE